MRIAILAGGLGTRLAEETTVKPKPMVEIGGRPILWHIMKHYAHYGFNEFLVALGYKGDAIKRLFSRLQRPDRQHHDRPGHGKVETHTKECEDWRVTWSTPAPTRTPAAASSGCSAGSTPKRSWSLTATACATSICSDLLQFHAPWPPRHGHGRAPPARFGGLMFEGDVVSRFTEKPRPARAGSTAASWSASRKSSTTSTATQQPGERGPGAPGRRRPTGRLPPRPILAVHGYPARQAAARSPVGTGQRTLEDWA